MNILKGNMRIAFEGAAVMTLVLTFFMAPLTATPVVAASPQQLRDVREAGLPADITVAEAAIMRKQGAFILDVREVSEWDEIHIPGSILIPLGQLPERLAEVPRDREVVVVCRTGNRSKTGQNILVRAGIRKAVNMQGGVTQWKTEGYPTVNGR
jgi:rhodanese-related sulfurtransferase